MMRAKWMLWGAALALCSTAALANVVVVKSLGPSAKAYPPGKTLPANAKITLQGGDVVTVIGPTAAQTLRGPGNFDASQMSLASAAGQRGRFSALRAAQVAHNPSIWDIDVTQSGKVCVTNASKVQLWRPDSDGAASVQIHSADGQSQNDLIYVPKNVHDQNEILFTGYNSTNAATLAKADSMANAFDQVINSVDCLKNARGTIMQRNACRNPWVNEFDVSIAQNLGYRFQNLQLRLDILNFGNLLNKNWGKQAFSNQGATCGQICSATTVLTQSGNKLPTGVTNSAQAQGIYTFDTHFKPFTSDNASSNYRMQISMRYSF